MTLNVNAARNEYTSGASQTIFNYTFKIYTTTDLDVYVTPAGQVCTDGDLTTSYTVAGVGLEAGGSITLATPANSGDLVTITSSIPTNRATDYQNNGDFRPDTVNDDFDRTVSLVKQMEDLSRRSLSFPPCEQGVTSLSLPPPVSSAFMRWKVDLSGLENFTFSSSGIVAEVSVTDYTAMRLLTSLTYTDGQVIIATNNGLAGAFIVRTGLVTDDGGTLIVFTDDGNRYAERFYDYGTVDARWFGAIALTDSTTAFQGAIDLANSNGGGTVTSGAETYFVSNTTSGTVEGAIEMKSNVHLVLPPGAEITKDPAERDVNGRIIGSGVSVDYNGPANIRISGFKLNDGNTTTGTRTQGDLINLNACTNVEIDNMDFGNCDFHFVDIRACKNVKIHDNVHTNLVLNSAAPYQLDVVTNATDSALFPNDNIRIYRNTQEKHSSLAAYHERVFEFAHQCTSKNIYIHDNFIDNTNNNVANNTVVGGAGEFDERFENINIYGNTFKIDSLVCWWIRINVNPTNPADGGNPNFIHGFKVWGNNFFGKTSQGIQISMVTATLTDFGDITGVDIYDNDFEWDLAVTTSASWSGINGELCKEYTVRNNRIKLVFGVTTYASTKNLEIVRCNSNQQMTCTDNIITITGTPSSNVQLRPITYNATHLVDQAILGTWQCERNEIHGDNFSPGILLNNYAGLDNDHLVGKVSRNFVHGTPQGASAHYSMGGNVWLSDGTNNQQYIDWGASGVVGETEVLALSVSFKLLNHPLPFKSESNMQPVLRGFINTSTQDLGILSMDITKQFLTATTTAGCSVEFNQTTNDDFNVLTGTDGVHMNFNETTFQPLFYATGFLRVLAGV